MEKILGIYYNKKTFLMIVLLFTFIITFYAAVSSLVYIDNGKLSYKKFSMQDQANKENIIPNFSYAGYMGGGVSLPNSNPSLIKQVVSPVEGNDRVSIQSAIDYVESLPLDENGIRGIVLLKKGNYQVNGTLTIKASGVVLIGEGQGENGTILHATLPAKHDFLIIQGSGNGIEEMASSTVSITSPYVPVGAHILNVSDASNFSVGDKISIKRTPNNFWIADLDMAQYGWVADDYAIKHERIITKISENTISINIPIIDVIEDKYGSGVVSKTNISGRISNCGIENIRLKSVYSSVTDEDHAWNAIVLKRTTNSWVKEVTAVNFTYSCVQIAQQSNFNTIEDCAMLDPISEISGGRRYSFYISSGLGNLFQRCYSRGGRHDYVTGARVTGPNVFLDCYAENTYNDIGPHHRWATGTLFDNIYGGQIRAQNRKDFGTGHGWAGVQTMFWNLKSISEDVKVESPKGGKNWAIGCEGLTKNGDGYWEQWNNRVTPRSLYLQQLKDRLGEQAIENISILTQRTEEPIWEALSSWAGKGDIKISVPGNATNPNPNNGLTNVSKALTLSWASGINASSHDIYFGTTNPPQFIKNQIDTIYNPGEILENTIYYWQIDEKNNIGTTKGKVWSFSISTNLRIDTISVDEDSFIHGGEGNTNKNFGTEDELVVKSNNIEKYVRETFLKFNLSSIDDQINYAKLYLRVKKDVSNVTHKVNFVSNDNWNENEITFNTKPSIGVPLDTKLVPALGEWIEFDVTLQVQKEITDDKKISFAISESSLNHYASYYSKENSNKNYSPKLIITHSKLVSIAKKNTSSTSFVLEQNYPNPFNPKTIIRYSIPKTEGNYASTTNVQLVVYDALGNEITTLFNTKQKPGTYEKLFNGTDLSSGVYYFQLRQNNFIETRKMILMK